MPVPLPTSSSGTCPRCAIDANLPVYGGVNRFWNVCDTCRSNTFVHDLQPPPQQQPRDEHMAGMASYSKDYDELSALFASADFSMTHRPHLWEPSDLPPAYGMVEDSAPLTNEPLRGVMQDSTVPRQDRMLSSFNQQIESQSHAYHHPPLGIADRRLEEDSTRARTQPLQQQQQSALQQQDQQMATQHPPQIYYASAHYNHSAHVVARQMQQQQQQSAEPYMHDGYAHMQTSSQGLWTVPSENTTQGATATAARRGLGENDVDMGG